MFFFSKKSTIDPSPMMKTDIHSHLIPCIDDGSQSLEESLDILRKMSSLGYEKVITTPHIMADTYRNSSKTILDGLSTLHNSIIDEKIDIKIDAAAEYYFDETLIDRLESDDILTIGDSYLLFETSYISKPINFDDIIFQISTKGYTPLLAHPERYRYISNPKKLYTQMKDMGICFQLDINSLGGHYGKQAFELSKLLIDWGMVDFLGSDIHHKKQVEYLKGVFVGEYYRTIWDKNEIKNDLL
ncbi:Capsular polysaccharide synthesis enzyme Cap8C; Manganese-dependent protein-tyrosine phosphatase [hydrothermal vent metagenome]|uniref:Capsular polysaccharide synthesis enzyme Cap8C Manganese-dependent protein-tyrosine phosphatase n=1 Tax=hydrothermal vent metagenome TaxID=652676 RepID=A0A1W1C4E0_9ZZZZ